MNVRWSAVKIKQADRPANTAVRDEPLNSGNTETHRDIAQRHTEICNDKCF